MFWCYRQWKLFIMDGKKRQPVSQLVVGDIGATLKLKDTETNTYCIRDGIIVVKKNAVIPNGEHIGLGA